MIRTLFSQLKEYRTASLLSPLFTALEVIMEILIPFIIAELIDKGIEAGNIHEVYRYGAIMLVMAFFSLAFGTLAGRFSAKASSGFACNLREGACTPISKPFLLPILISTAPRGWSPV